MTRRHAVFGIVALALLQLGDIVTTRLALGPHAAEANPIAAMMIGSPLVLAVKVGLVAAFAALVLRRGGYKVAGLMYGLWGVVGFYGAVVFGNLLVLAKLG